MPLTVFVKLTSNVDYNNINRSERQDDKIRCILQYRILPYGDWRTVRSIEKSQGTIALTAPPAAYFGRDNIDPLDAKPGDAIMIRYYATDGSWQSGMLDDMCQSKLSSVYVPAFSKYVLTLPNAFNYIYGTSDMAAVDLGGSWYPHFVITVIYSGNRRPIQ